MFYIKKTDAIGVYLVRRQEPANLQFVLGAVPDSRALYSKRTEAERDALIFRVENEKAVAESKRRGKFTIEAATFEVIELAAACFA